MAAERLGFDASYIRKMVLSGKIKAEKTGRDLFINESSLKNIKRKRKKFTRSKKDKANGTISTKETVGL